MRLAAITLALLIAATPASAQIVINGSRQAAGSQRERGAPSMQRDWVGELDRVEDRAERARERGEISRREERSIRRDAQRIYALGATFAASGLSEAELAVLESQTFALRDLAQAPARRAPPRRRGR
jgi:hypothetical protein